MLVANERVKLSRQSSKLCSSENVYAVERLKRNPILEADFHVYRQAHAVLEVPMLAITDNCI